MAMDAAMAWSWYARVVEAHASMEAPTKTCFDPDHAVNLLICFATAFLLIGVFHKLVAVHVKRQYYACHVFANSVITILTIRSVTKALRLWPLRARQ